MIHASELHNHTQEPLSEDRFINALREMTEQNYAYCLRAIQHDLQYSRLIVADNDESGRTINLGVIDFCFRQYIRLTDEQLSAEKKRYQEIISALLQAGARPGADFKAQVNKIYELAANLQSLSVWNEISDRHLTSAFQAMRDNDIHKLDALIKQNAYLVNMVGVQEQKTLLHEAAEKFDQDNPLSVQIFAYLIRKGADVTLPNADGQSIEKIMKAGHAASALFARERACLQLQPLPEISIEQMLQKARPIYSALKPYDRYILTGLVCSCVLWYLTRSGRDTTKQPEAALHLQQLT